MRSHYSEVVERGRRLEGNGETEPGDRCGYFTLWVGGVKLFALASDGSDWEASGLPGPRWEHVSVRAENRIPTWKEMCAVKYLFWGDDEVVMQLHPHKDDYVNYHPNVLHLWRPVGVEIPTPPKICV